MWRNLFQGRVQESVRWALWPGRRFRMTVRGAERRPCVFTPDIDDHNTSSYHQTSHWYSESSGLGLDDEPKTETGFIYKQLYLIRGNFFCFAAETCQKVDCIHHIHIFCCVSICTRVKAQTYSSTQTVHLSPATGATQRPGLVIHRGPPPPS